LQRWLQECDDAVRPDRACRAAHGRDRIRLVDEDEASDRRVERRKMLKRLVGADQKFDAIESCPLCTDPCGFHRTRFPIAADNGA
jgi:hypothetical protein